MSMSNRAVTDEMEIPRYEVIGTPDISEFKNGYEIPSDQWKPLLGGELETNLWDKILKSPGDKVIVGGGSVQKLVFGLWLGDTSGELITPASRSDLDISTSDPEVLASILELDIEIPENRFHKKGAVGNVEIDVTDLNKLRKEKIKGFEELIEICEQAQSTDKATTDLKGKIQKLELLKDRLQSATDEELIRYIATLPFETLQIELEKTETGEYKAILLDPLDYLVNYIDPIKKQTAQSKVETSGIIYTHLNVESLSYVYLQLLEAYKGTIETTTLESLRSIGRIGDIIKLACDKNIRFSKLIERAPNELDFDLVYEVIKRVMQETVVINVTAPENKQFKGKEFLIEETQEAFARGCASNMNLATEYILTRFPLGGILGPDFEEAFSTYHELINPNTDFWINLEKSDQSDFLAHYLKKSSNLDNDLPRLVKDIETYQTIHENIRLYFKNKDRKDTQEQLLHLTKSFRPDNMSEVIGILCFSIGLDIESPTDIAKIEEIVNSWKPQGNLKDSWKLDTQDFDQGLEKSSILEVMKTLKSLKLESSNK